MVFFRPVFYVRLFIPPNNPPNLHDQNKSQKSSDYNSNCSDYNSNCSDSLIFRAFHLLLSSINITK